MKDKKNTAYIEQFHYCILFLPVAAYIRVDDDVARVRVFGFTVYERVGPITRVSIFGLVAYEHAGPLTVVRVLGFIVYECMEQLKSLCGFKFGD